jgi:hypothetical protein
LNLDENSIKVKEKKEALATKKSLVRTGGKTGLEEFKQQASTD